MKGLPRYATGQGDSGGVREPETGKAPEHFGGNLLETDICDFALYAYRFPIDKDVRIHNIFVAGKEKMDFYVRNNPGPARVRYMDAPRYGTREPISEC